MTNRTGRNDAARGRNGGRRISVAVLALLALAVACGGNGTTDGGVVGGGGGGTVGGLTAGFVPDQANPGPSSVSASRGGTSSDQVTVTVDLTDLSGVYGALFDLTYAAGMVEFLRWSPGSALESGGQTVTYIVDRPSAGRLVIAASRGGAAPGVDVTGTAPLIHLTFRVTQTGNGPVAFQNMALQDAGIPPADIAVSAWNGGTITAN